MIPAKLVPLLNCMGTASPALAHDPIQERFADTLGGAALAVDSQGNLTIGMPVAFL